MSLYITLTATNKRISLPQYVAGWRWAKENPSGTARHGLNGWWSVTGEELLREYRAAMHDRINKRCLNN
jgi:hypothetical protein